MSEADWARPVVHWEIQARDVARMRDFYARIFNWEIGDGRAPQIGPGIGAPEQITGHLLPSEVSRVVLYVQVRDLRESLDRARELGGTIVREPFNLPTGVTLAAIKDPEENQLVLVQQ